jgi:hypothetical protein
MNTAFVMTQFCLKEFEKSPNTFYIQNDPNEFVAKANQFYATNPSAIKPGYASFCKHLFMPNYIKASPTSVLITTENAHLIISDYVARRSTELPVLTRWIPMDKITLKNAEYIDIILYSREQIDKESAATGIKETSELAYEYGIVSLKFQNEDFETPMMPITMMRNSMDIKYGGSGVTFSSEEYLKSVDYWKSHVSIR